MNKTEDSIKNNYEVCKNDGNKYPNMLYMINICCNNENNRNKTSFKVDPKTDSFTTSLYLEPKVKDV
jgi:hypothetical protein